MVLLTITAAAKEAIERSHRTSRASSPSHSSDDEPPLKEPKVGNPISHNQLIDIVRELQKRSSKHDDGHENVDLDLVLKGAQVYKAPPKPKPSPVGGESHGLKARWLTRRRRLLNMLR